MDHPDTTSFLVAQITIANWYLDRSVQSAGEDSSRYLRFARQAYDIVMHLLSDANLDEHSQRVHQELAVLRERLQVAKSGPDSLNGVAMQSSALLDESSAS